jgi:hypothetical protein
VESENEVVTAHEELVEFTPRHRLLNAHSTLITGRLGGTQLGRIAVR